MIFLRAILFTALLASPSFSAEPSRVWTDGKGRTMKGTLLDKSETHAEVLIKGGKRVSIELTDLSQKDRDYVAQADVLPQPNMTARTVKVKSNEAGTKYDQRKVEVTVEKVRNRSYSLTIHWLGPKGNSVGIYHSETKPVTGDDVWHFSVTYKGTRGKVGPDYKGYVVGLRGKTEFGEMWIQKSASQAVFERFLK